MLKFNIKNLRKELKDKLFLDDKDITIHRKKKIIKVKNGNGEYKRKRISYIKIEIVE